MGIFGVTQRTPPSRQIVQGPAIWSVWTIALVVLEAGSPDPSYMVNLDDLDLAKSAPIMSPKGQLTPYRTYDYKTLDMLDILS